MTSADCALVSLKQITSHARRLTSARRLASLQAVCMRAFLLRTLKVESANSESLTVDDRGASYSLFDLDFPFPLPFVLTFNFARFSAIQSVHILHSGKSPFSTYAAQPEPY